MKSSPCVAESRGSIAVGLKLSASQQRCQKADAEGLEDGSFPEGSLWYRDKIPVGRREKGILFWHGWSLCV